MSNSVWPQRRQPTRLPRPWDSPGKNTGVGCHFLLQCMKVKSEREVAQSYPTLSDPMDCSLPGSSIHGILQARVLVWGAIAFSVQRTTIEYKHTTTGICFQQISLFSLHVTQTKIGPEKKWLSHWITKLEPTSRTSQFSSVQLLSRVWLFATPWTAAYQAPLSMGFSRQEYWSGVPLPSPFFCISIIKRVFFKIDHRYHGSSVARCRKRLA